MLDNHLSQCLVFVKNLKYATAAVRSRSSSNLMFCKLCFDTPIARVTEFARCLLCSRASGCAVFPGFDVDVAVVVSPSSVFVLMGGLYIFSYCRACRVSCLCSAHRVSCLCPACRVSWLCPTYRVRCLCSASCICSLTVMCWFCAVFLTFKCSAVAVCSVF